MRNSQTVPVQTAWACLLARLPVRTPRSLLRRSVPSPGSRDPPRGSSHNVHQGVLTGFVGAAAGASCRTRPAFFSPPRGPGSGLAPLPVPSARPVVLPPEPAPEPASTTCFQNPLPFTTCFWNRLASRTCAACSVASAARLHPGVCVPGDPGTGSDFPWGSPHPSPLQGRERQSISGNRS